MPSSVDQAPQALPLQDRVHNALSVPRTKASIRPAPQDTALGPDVSTPPRDFHGPHVAPSNVLVQRALSVPRTKASTSFGDAPAAASGPAVRTPPSDVHGLHDDPFHDLVHSARSVPSTNT